MNIHVEYLYLIDRVKVLDDYVEFLKNYTIVEEYIMIGTDYKAIICDIDIINFFDYVKQYNVIDTTRILYYDNPDMITKY